MLQLYSKIIKLSDITLWPILNLTIRLYMANIFFKSGWLRFQDYLNGTWENQIIAFTEYHPTPGLSPEVAAVMGTGGEVILPILLAFGLFTRVGAAGLLVMTLVIQFGVPAEYELYNIEHYYWMMLLAVPMLRGGNLLSIDGLAQKFLFKNKNNSDDVNVAVPDERTQQDEQLSHDTNIDQDQNGATA